MLADLREWVGKRLLSRKDKSKFHRKAREEMKKAGLVLVTGG